ncbi:type I restriction-modification system subunit M [Halorhodospira halophila]|uniref:type I restriction-modification system subunit M n=1 Tax=Halorhodospira halophila TaxID=1053 RepID=UPI0019149982|nr:class I SAM-dependent DNA methyltransferase [Halorhodospira halophila]MBK5944753.1 type I restriction endonuclease subunit M [Halorhodospira halophila]
MALKKSQLYSSLWQSCDELRGGMDASQYKDYVLTLLFMKYVSDKKDSLIEVPEGGSFQDMVALKGDKDIGEKINVIISRLAEANDLKGVIDQADFNDETKLGSGKDMQDRLSKLVAIFEQLELGANRADGDDLLGDAYEYLMRHFATESGKSKGQFYTPAEVSRVIAQVVGIGPDTSQDETLYDPTCGSGSLLLRAAYEAPRGITIYGQENDNATWALAKMNMILHDYPDAELWRDNTLSRPYFRNPGGGLKTFDYAVANPPFSAKSWTNGLDPEHDEFGRFEFGVPPAKNGDYAFLLHLIKSLKSTGKGAIILPHGVLFRGHKEADIRRGLLRRGLIKGVIGLPPNLFYGTGIPACILVIDKEHAASRDTVFMVDASTGYMKDGNKNRLRSRDIHKIVDVFNNGHELPGFSRHVPLAEIASEANDYNLNIPRYIDSGEAEDRHDLDAHLNGGIPERDVDELDPYWRVLPGVRAALFADGDRPGYVEARVANSEVKTTVQEHPDFRAFADSVTEVIGAWQAAHRSSLMALEAGAQPRTVIRELAEDLLTRFADVPLLDRYAVYQRLLDYWADVMQDDLYLIAGEGWQEAARPRGVIENKARKIKEDPDLTVGTGKNAKKYKLDLIPPQLVVERFFPDRQASLEELRAGHEVATRELEEFLDEHEGDEDLLSEVKGDQGKVTKDAIKKRVKALKVEPDSDEEIAALKQCQKLMDAEASAKKAVKDAEAALNRDVLACYRELTLAEIKTLTVDDKWLTDIRAAINGEVDHIANQLAGRVRELEERYADPLPKIEREVAGLAERVAGHLRKMGVQVDG